MAKYQKTIVLFNELQLKGLQIGQYFKFGYSGVNDQYLGQTNSGSYVCRYGKFSTGNAKRNKLHRKYATMNGSK